jgi:hypothetical protein
MADAAWKEVDTTTIRNCWRKAGILPDISSSGSSATRPSIPISLLLTNPAAGAMKQVEAALDNLVATGALQARDRMDIASLLNPDGESQVLTETSDDEIYQSVIDAIKARENLEINGGDDVDDEIIEPRPMQRDVLKAVSTIRKYIDESDDPVSRKIEELLGPFN